MKEFFFGRTLAVGGFVPNDLTKPSITKHIHIPAYVFWKAWWDECYCKVSSKGIRLVIYPRYFGFFWEPYSPYYIAEDGKIIKNKRFQFLTFSLTKKNKKGSEQMNEAETLNPLPTVAMADVKLTPGGGEIISSEDGQYVQTETEVGEAAAAV